PVLSAPVARARRIIRLSDTASGHHSRREDAAARAALRLMAARHDQPERPPVSRRSRRIHYTSLVGIPAALAVVLVAQVFEGAPIRAVWQPTAAFVVFGGTLAATSVSYPWDVVRRTFVALRQAFVDDAESPQLVLARLVRYSHVAWRRGVMALESEID